MLKDRSRELLHSETPIELVGVEQSDNSFRERTPALQRSDRAAALVDREENYRRRIAMYAGESFHQPLSLAAPPDSATRPVAPPRPIRTAPPPAEAEPEGGVPWIILPVGAAIAAALWGLRRRRRGALSAP